MAAAIIHFNGNGKYQGNNANIFAATLNYYLFLTLEIYIKQ